MPLSVKDGGTWRSVKNVYVNDAGTWRLLEKSYANDAGTWRLGHQKFAATVSNANPTGYSQLGSINTSSPTVVTAVGGWPGYTYSWALLSGGGGFSPTANSPSSASTTFNIQVGGVQSTFTATFRCTITDTIGQSVTVDASPEWDST